ncbi:pre-mRNA-splicing factor SYF1-like, partial [Pezoporus wallicus]|uniref:pre-mRNA-splicing factor SYF1-like n=1 Tax=Pezoporus wallicus TaxID=35540 RepID=UPI00254A17CE
RATALPARRAEYFDSSEPVQNRLYKSLRLWSMLADLEESLGTFQSTKAVYERILDLRIATPQIVINYGLCLEERGYFEESFKAYERGVSLFRWPAVADIWLTYLTKFVARYGGRKLERARDLFEQALDGCPPGTPRPSTCCTRSWRRTSASPATPWVSTSAPRARCCRISSRPCSTSTSAAPPSSTASPTPGPSTSEPSRCWVTTRRGSCACALRTWRAAWGRWIGPAPSTSTARSSATPA